MRKKLLQLFLCVSFLCTVTPSYAEQLTAAQARQRLNMSLLFSNGNAAGDVADAPLYTAQKGRNNLFYVFSYGPQGFVIAGADTSVPEVLGYSTSGAFDADNIPDAMAAWLKMYEEQIALALVKDVKLERLSGKLAESNIAPMISTQWGQGWPYNARCPKINGTNCVTGCVATAMAQIMNYHRWPDTGEGSKGYTTSEYTVYANFSTANYNWDDMNGVDEVAKLMYHCGVAVEMDYGVHGSGAFSSDAKTALTEHFKYDPSIQYVRRYYYTDNDWEDLIYSELAHSRPVFYGGQGTGGHAFVCDGYQDGLYHFNWGWDGYCDGYFAITGLDALNPAGEIFSYNQEAVVGIQPKKEEPEPEPDPDPDPDPDVDSSMLDDLKNSILHRPVSPSFNPMNADYNGDGRINVLDVQALMQLLHKKQQTSE